MLAATLGLVNELLGGCLIAPGGQELHPTAAAPAWVDKPDNLEVDAQAWACIGLSLSQQVTPYFCDCAVHMPMDR